MAVPAGDGGEVSATHAEGTNPGRDGSRISFAPGTTFHDRSRLRSRGASQRVPATFTLRPVTSGDKVSLLPWCLS